MGKNSCHLLISSSILINKFLTRGNKKHRCTSSLIPVLTLYKTKDECPSNNTYIIQQQIVAVITKVR